MDRNLVFDAGVLTLGFAGDPRAKEFFDAVSEGRSAGFVSGANLAEFYYKTCQKIGKQTADTWFYRVMESGLRVVDAEGLDRLAGVEKCRHASELSLGDCFALALAKMEDALLLTTDGALAKVGDARVKHFVIRAATNH
jgi:predicted nucleic acid-binding protein